MLGLKAVLAVTCGFMSKAHDERPGKLASHYNAMSSTVHYAFLYGSFISCTI